MPEKLVVQVLTEDSGRDAGACVEAVFRSLAKQVDPDVATHLIDCQFPRGAARQAMGGNRWKGNAVGANAIARAIGTAVSIGDFVVVHVDGDVPWGKGTAENRVRFVAEVLSQLANKVADWPTRKEQIVVIVPHYSIEAWCYLNTSEVQTLVDEGRCQGQALTQIRGWMKDANGLDSVKKIKDACSLGSKFNLRLASKQYPADTAASDSPSFTQAIQAIEASPAFVAAFARTYHWGDDGAS